MAIATASPSLSTPTATPRPSVRFQVEHWKTYVADAPPLWEAHRDEVAMDQPLIPMAMDLDRYAALDAADILHIVTGRVEGQLVAYWVGMVMGHLHYMTTLHAFTDLYYVTPAWRKGPIALRLFGTAHRTLKARGVVKVASGTKLHAGLDNSRLFVFMGYRLTEKLYTKLLEG